MSLKPKLTHLSMALAAICLLSGCDQPFAGSNDSMIQNGAMLAAVYNVRSFGALGDGKAIDSHAINRAIATAAASGGGTVFLPAGTYLSGSIRMQSNINLHLDAGARIVGLPADSKEFDASENIPGPYFQDGGHTFFHNSLIWGENLRNVAITGQGMIDGGGITSRDKPVGDGPINLADKAIALKLCSQVLIRDVTLFHGGHFAILATGCDLMTLDNLTIDTNRDGMDIDCCRNTMVSNCRVNSPRDDGICPKSSFGLGENRLTENLTITNCQVSGFLEGTLLDGTMQPSAQRTGRIKFGTEANGGFRNVTVSNCTFRNCRGLALEEVDGGILENFNISNITMTDVFSYAIYITTGARNRGPNVKNPSILRNISIAHVTMIGVDANSGIQITGLPDHPIENLRLEDIQLQSLGGGTKAQAEAVPYELARGYPEPNRIGIMPAYGLFARHVKNLELANIRMGYDKEDLRPAIAFSDIQGLEIDNLKAQAAAGVPVGRIEAATGLTIRNSPVLEATGSLLKSDTARPALPLPPPPDTNNPAPERAATRPGSTTPAPLPPANNPDHRPDLPWLH